MVGNYAMSKYSWSEVRACFHGNEPWFNVFILKYLTMPLTLFLANYTRVSPNFVTMVSLGLGISSGYFYSQGHLSEGALAYFFSYICDAIDGKLARLTKRYTFYGSWFDIVVDRIVFCSVCLGLGYSQLPADYSLVLTGLLIFTFMLGFESRYNIQTHEIQVLLRQNDLDAAMRWHPVKATTSSNEKSAYGAWLERKGLVSSPFSLVEMLVFLFIIAPLIGMYTEVAVISFIILSVRILVQQKYWLFTR
jgi:phosphatidylglycerophosphate synthase